MNYHKLLIYTMLTVLLVTTSFAQSLKPTVFLTEKTVASFDVNGTLLNSSDLTGFIDVLVPNEKDVLQFIRIKLGDTGNTNLVSDTAFRNVAASVNGQKTRLFVSTVSDLQDTSYSINVSSVPTIFLQDFIITNLARGGKDLTPLINNMSINFTINASTKINTTLTFQVRLNTSLKDAMNFTAVSSSTPASLTLIDTNGNLDNDRFVWKGELDTTPTLISLNASILANVNYPKVDLEINPNPFPNSAIDLLGIKTGTLSGVTIINSFSRGPIREGIQMTFATNWFIRGFIQNIANGLLYLVDGFDLYKVGSAAPVVSSNDDFFLNPGEIVYTPLYESNANKLDFSAFYNWSVVFDTQEAKSSQFEIVRDVPTLLEIDIFSDKAASVIVSEPSRQVVNILDTVRHIGNKKLGVKEITINSVTDKDFFINESTVRVFYKNKFGSLFDITNISIINVTQPASPGHVDVGIPFKDALGFSLGQNEDILLSFQVFASNADVSQTLDFTSTNTIVTDSGTGIGGLSFVPPPSVEVPRGGKGRKVDFIDIFKEEVFTVVRGNITTVSLVDRIFDTRNRGAQNVGLDIFTPFGTSPFDIQLEFFENDAWRLINFTLTQKRSDFIDGLHVDKFSLDGNWTLHKDDLVRLVYSVSLPFGTHTLIARVHADDSYIRRTVFSDTYSKVRISQVGVSDLVIVEDLVQGLAEVDSPVSWYDTIDVFNNGSSSIEKEVPVYLFPDVLSVFLVSENPFNRSRVHLKFAEGFIKLPISVGSGEKKRYLLEIITPPVVTVRQKLNVIVSNPTTISEVVDKKFFLTGYPFNETTFEDYPFNHSLLNNPSGFEDLFNFTLEDDSSLKIMLNVSLENLAEENYQYVRLVLPIKTGDVIAAKLGELSLNYNKEGDQTVFIIPRYLAFSKKSVLILYRQEPPILHVDNPRQFVCGQSNPVSLTLITKDQSTNAFVELELSKGKKKVWADINYLGFVREREIRSLPVDVALGTVPSGVYELRVIYRDGFDAVLSVSKNVNIVCVSDYKWLVLIILLIFISFILWHCRFEGRFRHYRESYIIEKNNSSEYFSLKKRKVFK